MRATVLLGNRLVIYKQRFDRRAQVFRLEKGYLRDRPPTRGGEYRFLL